MSNATEERDTGILSVFLSHKDSKDCFRFFARTGSNVGVFVLGWWATFTASEYIKSETVLKTWRDPQSGEGIPVVVLNDALCKEVIADCLLRRGASVEFYDKNIRGVYECVQRGSPGNITDFEATLFEQEEAAIQLMASGSLVFGGPPIDGRVHVGLCALNTTLRQISVAEYRDSLQLVDLDVLISQTNIKELVLTLPPSGGSGRKSQRDSTEGRGSGLGISLEGTGLAEQVQAVHRICDRLRVNFTVQTTAECQQRGNGSSIEALKDLLRVPEERIQLLDLKLGSQALEVLLQRLDVLDPNQHHAYYLRHVIPSTFMKLDSAAVEALHIFSARPDPKGMAPSSLFGWLNRCTTGMGSRVLRQWLLQPLRSAADISQRQAMVQLFIENTPLRDALVTEVLRRCGDMDRMNRKLMRRRLALKDMKGILQIVDVLPKCVQILRVTASSGSRHGKLVVDEYVAPLEEIADHTGNLRLLIESSVDFSDRVTPRINPAFDDALGELHKQITTLQVAMEKEYHLVMKRYGWSEKTMKMDYHTSYGYVFRVSRKEDRELRAAKELITLNTAKDGVRFVSENLSALSKEYKNISEEYERRQEALKQKLVDTVASYLPLLDDAKELLASLDVFVAWALVVRESPRNMVCPRVHDAPALSTSSSSPSLSNEKEAVRGAPAARSVVKSEFPILHFHQLRHPLVELRNPDYQANSLRLTQETNGIIITGPNMGGKSTFMRSVGIAVILAQIGCFVPAEAAEITIRDAVMCRVGATDHLSQGVSTFMVEMLESSAILSHATADSLTIVDELGRGTSTYDGFGLAWAIAKEIGVHIGSTLLFSTHFHEMTELPAQCPNLQNFHFGAEVNEEAQTLRFLYQLEPGPCGQSYGLYVAALANMPAEVVENARRKAAALEQFETATATAKGGDGPGSGCGQVHRAVASVAATPEACQRLHEFARRVRLASEASDHAELKRIRAEVMQDELIGPVLTEESHR